jgi:hypothetical protein
MPALRRDRIGKIAGGDLPVGDEGDLDRRRIPDRLGEDADLVVEVGRRAEPAVPPGLIARAAAHGGTRLVLLRIAAVHRGAHHREAVDEQGIDQMVVRVTERRGEEHGPRRAGLVMVVHDLREPLAVHRPADVLGFGHRVHVEVAIVVVPDVLLVEPRNPRGAAPGLVRAAHVPARHQLHAVRIGVNRKLHDVIQQAHRFGVVPAGHLPDVLHQLVSAEHLGGVQAAIDPDHRLALLGQRPGLGRVHAFRAGEPGTDLPQPIELRVVRGAGDDHHPLIAPFGGLADRHQLEPVRLGVELPPVLGELRVGGEAVVIADVPAELLLGRGDAALGRNDGGKQWYERECPDGRTRVTERMRGHGGVIPCCEVDA